MILSVIEAYCFSTRQRQTLNCMFTFVYFCLLFVLLYWTKQYRTVVLNLRHLQLFCQSTNIFIINFVRKTNFSPEILVVFLDRHFSVATF